MEPTGSVADLTGADLGPDITRPAGLDEADREQRQTRPDRDRWKPSVEQYDQQITDHRSADHRGRQVTFAGRAHQVPDAEPDSESSPRSSSRRPVSCTLARSARSSWASSFAHACFPPATVSSAAGSIASHGIITKARR